MAIIKKYSKNKKICRVTFKLSKGLCKSFKKISLVGDFNDWNVDQNKFIEKNVDGSSSIELMLKGNAEYQFKYFCDDHVWLNEPEADTYVAAAFKDSENSVLLI
ncbi:MAG: isoamylase early set domain-containing protein [Ignavibacteriaceae bacterium]|nr:isoamylase early set domain-containing protein [Ignavibacteriaceae bacterium]